MKAKIIRILEDINRVAITVDGWTTENGCGLLGVTVHWIDARWTYRELVLAVRELYEMHDAESMAEILAKVLEEYGLDTKLCAITTDNASSNKRMMAILGRRVCGRSTGFSVRRHVPCVTHIVNIVVQAALKSFSIPTTTPIVEEESDVGRTANMYDSGSDMEEGEEDISLQRRNSSIEEIVTKPRLPSLDCPTRWSSTHDMLEEATAKRDVMDAGAAFFTTGGSQTKISRDEWELLKEFALLLGPFAYTTDHVIRSKESVIGDVLLLVRALVRHMDDVTKRITESTLFTCKRLP
ncbi:putative transcriptional regulator tpeD [Wolffia australiana]